MPHTLVSHESYSECFLQIPFIFMENSSGSELLNSDRRTGRCAIKSRLYFLDSFMAAVGLLNIFFFFSETSRQEVHKSTPKLGMASALYFSSLSNPYFFSPGWPRAHYVAGGDFGPLDPSASAKCWDYGVRHHVVSLVLGKDQGLELVRQGRCSLGCIPCTSLVSWTCIWHIEIFFLQ